MSGNDRQRRAFSLVEVTLALGVLAFCLMAILGLLPVGLNSNKTSIQQTAASSVLTAVEGDLRSTLSGPFLSLSSAQKTSPHFQIPIPDPGAASTITIFTLNESLAQPDVTSTNDTALYRVQITFVPPAIGQRTATIVHIFVSWPALADRSTTTAPTHYSGFVEAVLALDRN